MSVILKELTSRKEKNALPLGFIKRKLLTKPEFTNFLADIDAAAKSQAELGLGNPTRAVSSVKSQIDKATKFEYAKLQALALQNLGVFEFIESPDKSKFPRFNLFDKKNPVVSLKSLPKFAMARLGKNVSEITVNIPGGKERGTWKAQIPLMPTSVQALAKRAKEVAPNGKFHLLYEPSWQKQPEPVIQRDPVLVMEIASRWAVIGHWDNDAELIKQELKASKKGSVQII